jgi:cyclophilin family peptidyl-prolyl cis-trans isomerase
MMTLTAVSIVALSLMVQAVPAPAAKPAQAPAKPAASAKKEAAPKPVKPAKLQRPQVTITTSKGVIVLELFPNEAPRNVSNLINLAQRGFYKGLKFHRIEDWVAQGGDPLGDGSGGPGYTVENETNRALKHIKGAVGMANAGRDTAGSQFYVLKKDAPQLDNGQYTLVGIVMSGIDVIDKLAAGDVMTDIKIDLPGGYKPKAVGPSRGPEASNRVTAILPEEIASKQITESIDVEISVQVNGASTVKLKRGTGDKNVDDAVLAALGEWVWVPALKDGTPYATTTKWNVDIFSMIRKRLP